MPIFQIILREIHKIFCGVVKRNVQKPGLIFLLVEIITMIGDLMIKIFAGGIRWNNFLSELTC